MTGDCVCWLSSAPRKWKRLKMAGFSPSWHRHSSVCSSSGDRRQTEVMLARFFRYSFISCLMSQGSAGMEESVMMRCSLRRHECASGEMSSFTYFSWSRICSSSALSLVSLMQTNTQQGDEIRGEWNYCAIVTSRR